MSLPRRLVWVSAAAAAVAVFGAGVAVGFALQPSPHRASVLDEAQARIQAQAARPVSRTTLQRAAVEGMLGALDDRWSSYYAPAAFERFAAVLEGRYAGVGIWVRRTAAGQVVVMSVQHGSPADLGALRPGDVVVSVDGRSVAGRSVADVVSSLRGDAGTSVTVVVQRGEQRLVRLLQRENLDSEDVSLQHLSSSVVELRVTAFTHGVGRWVRETVAQEQAKHAAGIVLDLRGNPGGLLDEAVETAAAFLRGGEVVSYERRGQPPQVLDAGGDGDSATPLVVLVDAGTASAAEVVAGALQDRGRAVVIGSRTFGKGSVQEPTRLSDGSAFELTVGDYRTPSGRSIDGVGIDPDVAVSPSAGTAAPERRAVEVLSGLLADAGTAGRG